MVFTHLRASNQISTFKLVGQNHMRTGILIMDFSENGIVAVFGDENQFVKGGIRKINSPLSLEREHMDQFRVNDANR